MIIYFQTYGFIHYIVHYIYVYNRINFLRFVYNLYVGHIFIFTVRDHSFGWGHNSCCVSAI